MRQGDLQNETAEEEGSDLLFVMMLKPTGRRRRKRKTSCVGETEEPRGAEMPSHPGGEEEERGERN